MKKTLALILSLLMCVSLFTACGNGNNNGQQDSTTKTLVVGT